MIKETDVLTTEQRLEIYKEAKNLLIEGHYMCTAIYKIFETLHPKQYRMYGFGFMYWEYFPFIFPEFWSIKPAKIIGEKMEGNWFGIVQLSNTPNKYNRRNQFFDTIITRTEYKLKKENERKSKTTA